MPQSWQYNIKLSTVSLTTSQEFMCNSLDVNLMLLHLIRVEYLSCLDIQLFFCCFRFDFCGRAPLPLEETSDCEFTAKTSGTCHAFFMWWDLDMDMSGDVLLSCAPHWEHPDPKHTMQVSGCFICDTLKGVSFFQEFNLAT